MLSKQMAKALDIQKDGERLNAAFYDMLSAGLDGVSWPGSSKFMKHSADDERLHAQILTDYLIDQNETPTFGALQSIPSVDGDDIVPYFQLALEREKITTSNVRKLYKQALDEEDWQTISFLTLPREVNGYDFPGFLEEQTRSEREITDILIELVDRADAGARVILDREYGSR